MKLWNERKIRCLLLSPFCSQHVGTREWSRDDFSTPTCEPFPNPWDFNIEVHYVLHVLSLLIPLWGLFVCSLWPCQGQTPTHPVLAHQGRLPVCFLQVSLQPLGKFCIDKCGYTRVVEYCIGHKTDQQHGLRNIFCCLPWHCTIMLLFGIGVSKSSIWLWHMWVLRSHQDERHR